MPRIVRSFSLEPAGRCHLYMLVPRKRFLCFQGLDCSLPSFLLASAFYLSPSFSFISGLDCFTYTNMQYALELCYKSSCITWGGLAPPEGEKHAQTAFLQPLPPGKQITRLGWALYSPLTLECWEILTEANEEILLSFSSKPPRNASLCFLPPAWWRCQESLCR